MFIFLLFGLFCRFGFSGVYFLLFGRVRVLFFAVWAGTGAPPKQQKKTHPPKQQKINTPPTLLSVFFFFLAVWAGGRFFLLFERVSVFIVLLFGRGSCFFCYLGGVRVFFCFLSGCLFFFFVCCLGRGVIFFAVWAGGGSCFRFCCLGGWIFFLLFGRGTGVHSLTGPPGSSFRDPTTKKTKQQKKTRVPRGGQGQINVFMSSERDYRPTLQILTQTLNLWPSCRSAALAR